MLARALQSQKATDCRRFVVLEQMSGFCTGAALASRGGANAAFKAGMVGGIILAVIEGLNIGMVRMFSNIGPPPEEPIMMAQAGAGEAHAEAEQPWWHPANLLAPAPPPPDVDFSDPKEVRVLSRAWQGCSALRGPASLVEYACIALVLWARLASSFVLSA